MATLTAWAFPRRRRCRAGRTTAPTLQKQQLITIQDAAIVTWPAGTKKPKTRQLNNLAGAGALGGAFWGMLFGLLFFIPLSALAIGAGDGRADRRMADVGIDDNFINAREQGDPGHLGAVPAHLRRRGRPGRGGHAAGQGRADRQQPVRRAGGQAAEVFSEE